MPSIRLLSIDLFINSSVYHRIWRIHNQSIHPWVKITPSCKSVWFGPLPYVHQKPIVPRECAKSVVGRKKKMITSYGRHSASKDRCPSSSTRCCSPHCVLKRSSRLLCFTSTCSVVYIDFGSVKILLAREKGRKNMCFRSTQRVRF